ncbi:hypothetical protein OK016_02195 [Vibrio chagasii]|nr:hypothetical protein [Vibrio chagasii]
MYYSETNPLKRVKYKKTKISLVPKAESTTTSSA